ncbi:MAG: DUF5615 family PIN-like protein [Planctomycetes bacterium]|nr:DUF5615 family PIN-like protein [Planctomycetota bacterium]
MISYYFDEHVPGAVVRQLKLRGIDVILAQQEGPRGRPDDVLIARATQLGRVFVTQDAKALPIVFRMQAQARPFSGFVLAEQSRVNIGILVRDLELMALVYDPSDMANRIELLPL